MKIIINENQLRNIINEGFIKLTPYLRDSIEYIIPMVAEVLSGEYLGDGQFKYITTIYTKSADGENIGIGIGVGNNVNEPDALAYYLSNDKKKHYDNVIVFQQFNFVPFFKGPIYNELKSEGNEKVGIELIRSCFIHELIHARDPNSNHKFDDEPYSKTIKSIYYKSWKEFKGITGQFLEAISSGIDRSYNLGMNKNNILDALDNILKVYAGKEINFNQNAVDFIQGNSIKLNYIVIHNYSANLRMIKMHNPQGYKKYLRELYKTIEESKKKLASLNELFFKRKKKMSDDEFMKSEEIRFTCADCGEKDYKMYMVNDDIWKKYGNDKLTLCRDCFEKRIGRKLTKDDIAQYKDALANKHNSELKNLYN